MTNADMLLVQDSGASDSGSNLLGFIVPLVIIGGLFYAFLILPQRRRMKGMQALRDSVEIGDEIRTVGGIYGTVNRMDDESVVIDVGGGTTLRISRRAVADKLGDDDE